MVIEEVEDGGARPKRLIKGKGRAILAPTRLIGKDAKLAALVREANKDDQEGGQESSFDAKKIGKKPVFRPILTSPFTVKWPSITPVYADVILHSLLKVLQRQEVQQIFIRDNVSTPKQSSRKTKEKNKRRRMRMVVEVLKQHGVALPPKSAFANAEISAEKKASEQTAFVCGINSITRHLETLIRDNITKSDAASTSSTRLHDPSVIFVCLSDIDPPALVSHFPLLVSTFNAVMKRQCVLICLPEDSEAQICEAVHLRRCSCISVDPSSLDENTKVDFGALQKKIRGADLTPTRLDWLDNAIKTIRRTGESEEMQLLEPQIKHLRSSAPLDMNAVKRQKREDRSERRQSKKERSKVKSSTNGNVKRPLTKKEKRKMETAKRLELIRASMKEKKKRQRFKG